MKRLLMLGVMGIVFTLFAAAQIPSVQTPPPEEGNATWYETPDRTLLEAKHAMHPNGTRIRVINMINNKNTIVTIRGQIPSEPGHILDISEAAAKNLEMDMSEIGSITPVKIEFLMPELTQESSPTAPASPTKPTTPIEPSAPAEPTTPIEPSAPAEPTTPAAQVPPGDTRPLTIQTIININGATVEVVTNTGEAPSGTATATPTVTVTPTATATPTATVTPPPIPKPTPTPAPTPSPSYMPPAVVTPNMPNPGSGNIYRVQVGSFQNPLFAQNAFEKLRAAGFSPFYERYKDLNKGDLIRVVLSGVRASDMQRAAQLLGNAGFHEVWIRQEN